MADVNNYREIFRPTMFQKKRMDKLMASGHFKHRSELLRRALEIGLDELEKKYR